MYRLGNNILKLNDKLISKRVAKPYPTDGLVARWAFEDNLNDSFYNRYNLSFYDSGAGLDYVTGKIGKAADKKTLCAFYTLESNIYYSIFNGTGNYTIAGWYYHNGLWNSDGRVGMKRAGRYTCDDMTLIGFRFTGDIDKLRITCRNANPTSDYRVDVTSILGGNFQQDTWYHIAQTFDGSQIKTYLNGELLDTVNNNSAIYITTSHDGYCPMDSGESTGKLYYIDNHYVYNRALTLEEIQQLYNE